MTHKTLTSRAGALDAIAGMFQRHSVCTVSIRDDRAFQDNDFLSLGQIELFPPGTGSDACTLAVRGGMFEWRTPQRDETDSALQERLGIDKYRNEARLKADAKVRRILDLFGSIPVRLGLGHPVFDPHALGMMPFPRPTTIVSDTSGVLQGGLSFVSRYLYPAARVKVPAIVQTEIVNLADRFLKNRRAPKVKPLDLLMDHFNSQSGQRVLLQLELHSNVELERTFLLGDPLRGAFEREGDQDLRELNLHRSIRSYVDRLILEAARQHQSQVTVGHPVMLLTADQGLARMAMAEGMQPLYCRAAVADAFFGRHFTGANFHPFSGELCTTSIPAVLWELATIAGAARLTIADSPEHLVVHAIGEDLAWAPYHSRDDLLWIEAPDDTSPRTSTTADQNDSLAGLSKDNPDDSAETQRDPEHTQEDDPPNANVANPRLVFYKFSLDRLITLIDRLETVQELTVDDVMEVLDVRATKAAKDYRLFLESGHAIQTDKRSWRATPVLSGIAIGLRNGDTEELRNALRTFPTYGILEEMMLKQPISRPIDTKIFRRAASTLVGFAEITRLGATVYGTGFFPTPCEPEDQEFADIALSAYEALEKGSGWAETGRWLEELVVVHGIHPAFARVRLQTASERGLVGRVTEGSTTETAYDRHTVKVLESKDGVPFVKTEHLYRGDFLIPGKSSSSLRIQKGEQ